MAKVTTLPNNGYNLFIALFFFHWRSPGTTAGAGPVAAEMLVTIWWLTQKPFSTLEHLLSSKQKTVTTYYREEFAAASALGLMPDR
jgi:hypothetical protein